MAVIDKSPSGSVRGTNLLALYPRWTWLGMLAPMPVFFATGGWANAHSSIEDRLRRLRSLTAIAATVIGIWSAVSVLEIVVTHRSGALGDGARIATQPLWFLAAYVPLVSVTHVLARWSTHIITVMFTCVGIVTLSDVAQFVFHAPRWMGYPGFFATWLIPWMIGMQWRSLCEKKNCQEEYFGVALAVTGAIASLLLLRFASYSPTLIDAVPGRRSNTTPPTLFTCSAAVMQVGILIACAHRLDAIAKHCQRVLQQLNAVAVGVYAWHLTALAVCAGFIAMGAPMPTRFTTDWWILRLPWFTIIIAITALLVFVSQVLQKSGGNKAPGESSAIVGSMCGVGLITVGSAITGLYGPRTLPSALAMTTLFIGGWALLRQNKRTPSRSPRSFSF